MRTFTRRDFLKVTGAATPGLAFRLPPADDRLPAETPIGLGRVTRALQAYDQPSFSGKKVRVYGVDTVLNIYDDNTGDAETSHNAIWFRVGDGWVHSSFVQPVRNDLNEQILDIPAGGCLAELTVPFTQAWRNDDGQPQAAYRYYYSSTHWVDRAVTDSKANVWYRVLDDRYQVYYFVLAQHLRRVPAEELTPSRRGSLTNALK